MTEKIGQIFAAIIGLAVLSVLISSKAKTAGVIQALGSGFNTVLGAAIKPVS